MATPTTLEGMLRNDEDNLSLRLVKGFGQSTVAGRACQIKLYWKPHGSSSAGPLCEPIPIAQANGTAVDALVDEVARAVIERQGNNPLGQLRIQAHVEKQARAPFLDFTRTLVPQGAGDIVDPNLMLVRAMFEETRRDNALLQNLLVQAFAQSQNTLQNQAQVIATLGTQRAAASTGNDLSGLGPLIGLGAFLMFAPMIKATLGLPENASYGQILAALRGQLTELVGPAPTQTSRSNLPRQELRLEAGPAAPPAAITETPEAPEAPTTPEADPDPDQVIADLGAQLARPEVVAALLRRVNDDPDLKGKLQQFAAFL